MKPTHQKRHNENEENDFLDALVSTGASMAILMGIFLLVTVISLIV